MAIKIEVVISGQNRLMTSLDKMTVAINELKRTIEILNSRFSFFSTGVNKATKDLKAFNDELKRGTGRIPSPPSAPGSGTKAGRPPKTFGELMIDMIATSRFGGGMMSPLVGRAVTAVFGDKRSSIFKDMAGMFNSFVSKFGFAGKLISVAMVLLGHKIGELIESIVSFSTNFSRGMASAGSSTTTSGILNALGAALGTNVLGGAKGFQGSISTGAGAAFAASQGITPLGGAFGDVNYGEKMKKYVTKMLLTQSNDLARRMAVATGTEDMLRLRELSPETRKRILGTDLSMPDKSRSTYTDFSAQMGIFGGETLRTLGIALAPLFQLFTVALKIVNPILQALGGLLDMLTRPLLTLYQALGQFIDMIINFFGGGNNSDPIQANTKALNANTRILTDQTEMLGNSNRAAKAFPSKIRYGLATDNFSYFNNKVRLGML